MIDRLIVKSTFMLLICLLAGCSHYPRLHKVLMPGEHQIELKPSFYQVWIFRTWKSKGVQASADNRNVDVQIVGPDNKPVSKKTLASDFHEAYEKTKNDGNPDFTIELERSGIYKVSSDKACVVVFVPSEAIYRDLANFAIAGIDNDDFDP